jgi:hypothetical protein
LLARFFFEWEGQWRGWRGIGLAVQAPGYNPAAAALILLGEIYLMVMPHCFVILP